MALPSPMRVGSGMNTGKRVKAAKNGNLDEDVERLFECFKRGLSQRNSNAGCGEKLQLQALGKLIKSPSIHLRGEAFSMKDGAQNMKAILDNCEANLEVAMKTPNFRRRRHSITKEVTPGVFYGSPTGKPAKKPPQLLRLLDEIHKDLAAEEEPPSRVWATFPRQDEAFQFVDSHGTKEISVFAYQDHITGQRRYLATSYAEFWHRYHHMPSKYRHHYEIIREGLPCHLYFDLEYNCVANKGLNGEAMVDLLLSEVSKALLDIYSLKYEPTWTVELDSTTEEKFSRHLIVHISKAAFKDNSHAGAFVGEVCSRLSNDMDIDNRLNQLYVLKGESRADCQTQLFLDQAVYSRNRSFRLPFSSKAGKTAQLLPTGRFRCKGMDEYDIFMDSVICNVGEDCERLLTFGGEVTSRAGSIEVGSSHPLTLSKIPKFGSFCLSGMSPFPVLDTFIESIACIGNIPGKIRSWYWFSEYGVVVYNISGNRYCEHIGRPHKSNNVMYIVDFRTAGYYQKCHDPDCRGGFEVVNGRIHIEETYDEAWWKEVIACATEIECQPRPCNQVFLADIHSIDDNWWKAVEKETEKLEELKACDYLFSQVCVNT
eukprot:c24342_g1_i1 orf=428-2221(+)